MKKIKNLIVVLLLTLGVFVSAMGCSLAEGISKYSPKDSNPKPGMYKTGDMQYAREGHSSILLKNGLILLIGSRYSSNCSRKKIGCSSLEIYNPLTGKFKKTAPMLYSHQLFYNNYIVIDDNQILFSNGSSRELGDDGFRDGFYEIYNIKENKFYPVGQSRCKEYMHTGNMKWIPYQIPNPDYIEKLDNGNIAIYYCTLDREKYIHYKEKGLEVKAKYTKPAFHSYEMEIYDVKQGVLLNPIREGEQGYIKPKRTIKKVVPDDLNIKVSKICPGAQCLHMIDDNKILFVNREEVDYGIPVTKAFRPGLEHFNGSWFSPMYVYDLKNNKITKVGEYIRSKATNITAFGKNK